MYKVNVKIEESKENWKPLTRMNSERVPLMIYKYRPRSIRDVGRPRKRWRQTKEDGTGILPHP